MSCLCRKDGHQLDQISVCMSCHNGIVTHIREFNYRKLPDAYFHEPHDYVLSILKRQNIDTYPDYWIQLPPGLKLTRYQYRVCDNCYNQIQRNEVYPWNEWRDL